MPGSAGMEHGGIQLGGTAVRGDAALPPTGTGRYLRQGGWKQGKFPETSSLKLCFDCLDHEMKPIALPSPLFCFVLVLPL